MIYVRKGKSRWKKYSITLFMEKKKSTKEARKYYNMPCTMSQGTIDFLILLREYDYNLLVEI